MSRVELAQLLHDREHWTACKMKWGECMEFHRRASIHGHEEFYLVLADRVLALFEVEEDK